MNAKTLLDTLRRRGVVLAVVGDELRYRPRQAVDGTTLALLREHKAALVALLRGGQAVDQPPPSPTPPEPVLPPPPPSPQPPPLPGWPAGVAVPEWWAELAGPMGDVLVEAAAHECADCGFAVAVRWRPSDGGAPRWACPRCGLSAGDGERPGADAELPPVVRAGGWDAIVVRDACAVCGFPPEGPKDDQGRCAGCAARVSPA
jgi:predicted RNA-binding Zn-ribbon protein involved in translation (DUF1610 family)